jgi:hypothetical protein
MNSFQLLFFEYEKLLTPFVEVLDKGLNTAKKTVNNTNDDLGIIITTKMMIKGA